LTLEEVYRNEDFLRALEDGVQWFKNKKLMKYIKTAKSSDEKVLDYIETVGLSAATIAERMKCSREEAKLRMRRLVEYGVVIESKVSSSGRLGFKYIWQLAGPLEDMLKKLSEIEEQETRDKEEKARKSKEKSIGARVKSAEKRRENVLKTLDENKPMSVNGIMKITGYSYSTILRQLQILEKQKKVRKYKDTNKWLKKV
jgi:predicted ArsR family transcriptional regulator